MPEKKKKEQPSRKKPVAQKRKAGTAPKRKDAAAAAKKGTRTGKPPVRVKPAVKPVSRKRTPAAKPAAARRLPAAVPAAPEPETYQPGVIEPKWQKIWDKSGLYRSTIDPKRKKHYALTMLPYPSGNLHIGHWYAMTPSDARARFKRMQGFNVLFPMGFDAFGLPAENAAIKDGIHPLRRTYANIENMRKQLRSMGAMFDWEREMVSCDPAYYRWTQWFFIQLFRHKLAYKKQSPVDWCPACNTTLAREQVWGDDRHCERCGTPVTKKTLDQWYFATTRYAEELLDFSDLDWPDRVREMQTHWIGRSEGAHVVFTAENGDPIEVFTTRPDTLWGATFMVLAPEHPLVAKLVSAGQRAAVEEYAARAVRQTDIDRESAEKEKTGVFVGACAINPVNGARVPIWIADYVLMSYGTGAIMAVPAHDKRDFDFAIRYGLPIQPVIERTDRLAKSFILGKTMRPGAADALRTEGIPFLERDGCLYVTIPPRKIDCYVEIAREFLLPSCWNEIVGARWQFLFADGIVEWDSAETGERILTRCKELEPGVRERRSVMEMLWAVEFYRDALFHDDRGPMIHSGEFSGTPGAEAVRRVAQFLESRGQGRAAVTYRLRDWLISRQRYWGAPIPIVHCPVHGQVPVPDDQLPVLLPEDVEWRPTGESPLKLHPSWSKTVCPVCGGLAERDTDTMDTFMCSSWYHLRYLSPQFDRGPFDPAEYDYWMPVDTYTGGAEHATMHLIYTRFFHKACRDMGITRGSEPMRQLRNQGQILGPDGQRMSKSRGNVIDPDEQVAQYGADTVRCYLMFGYQWSEGGPWNTENIQGVVRWLHRVWLLGTQTPKSAASAGDERALLRAMHQAIQRTTRDLEGFQFNTVISTLMEYTNALFRFRETPVYGTAAWEQAFDTLLLLTAPVAPHLAEELWSRRKGKKAQSIHLQAWPPFDPALAAEDTITIVVQVNGKIRERLQVPAGTVKEEAQRLCLENEVVRKWMEGRSPRQVIFVPDKLINIVL